MRHAPRNWPAASAVSDAFRALGAYTKDPMKGLCFAAPSVYIGIGFEPVLSHTSQVLARCLPGGMKREHQCRHGARRSAQFVLTTALPSSATASLGLYPQL
ncbi:hypothetical protein GGP87_001301 [Salinibacter ruber]|nr:hypothetical protein [Salinibacter ruber]